MTFKEAIFSFFPKFRDGKGRASQLEFMWFMIFMFVFVFIATIIDDSIGIIAQILIIIPFFHVIIRRLHDINLSGWWALFMVIFARLFTLAIFIFLKDNVNICITKEYSSFLMLIPIIILGFIKGNNHKNKYGQAPFDYQNTTILSAKKEDSKKTIKTNEKSIEQKSGFSFIPFILILIASMSILFYYRLSPNYYLNLGDKNYKQGNYFEAAKKYEIGCNTYSYGCCGKLGDMYIEGKGVVRNLEEAANLYLKGCKNEDAYSCYKIAMGSEGYDNETAKLFYQKACNLKLQDACDRFSMISQ